MLVKIVKSYFRLMYLNFKYQLAEDEKMCEQDLKQLNLTNEENPSKGETSSNESALIEYKSVVIYKSKAVLHFFQNQ